MKTLFFPVSSEEKYTHNYRSGEFQYTKWMVHIPLLINSGMILNTLLTILETKVMAVHKSLRLCTCVSLNFFFSEESIGLNPPQSGIDMPAAIIPYRQPMSWIQALNPDSPQTRQ